jgi:glutathione S-transferase
MKLYDSVRAPNPRRVRIFLAEKGIEVPRVMVDLASFEHRTNSQSSIRFAGRRRSNSMTVQ